MTDDIVLGALLGTAVGDALGMPIEGLSHQNVRTYYLGIKEYRADEQRKDLDAGQWTDDTQFTFAVARAYATAGRGDWPQAAADAYVALQPEARRWGPTTTAAVDRLADGTAPEDAGGADRPTDGAAMRAAPLGLWWAATTPDSDVAWDTIRSVLAVTHRHPVALAAGWGQAWAVQHLATTRPDAFTRDAFWTGLVEATTAAEARLDGPCAVSDRLRRLRDDGEIDSFPLDVRDACDGVSVRADEAWPFACAMVARRPHLLENTLLSGINVGGDADTTGAMMGAMLGALHGWDAFPDAWKDGVEAAGRLADEATAFARALRSSA
jgi:ADP-ribosylglycohydrolase